MPAPVCRELPDDQKVLYQAELKESYGAFPKGRKMYVYEDVGNQAFVQFFLGKDATAGLAEPLLIDRDNIRRLS